MAHESFPPDIMGGGEKLVYRLTKDLIKNGHSVKVLTSGNPEIEKYDGIRTIRIPVNRYMMNLTLPAILKHAKDSDIIQTSSGNACFPSWIASRILKKPICCLICHVFGSYWKDVREGFDGRVFEFMENLFLTRDYDSIVFLNNSSKKLGVKIGMNENKAFVLNPGIDYKKFQLKNVKKEPFVLFVGNYSMTKSTIKIKGLEYLIKAAKRLPDIKFVIVGNDKNLSYLKSISSSNVMFMGRVREKTLIELYNKALIFCLPSLTEGFGFTILEAMASGCSVISTIDLGQEGMILRPKNTEDIIKAIKYRVNNQKQAIMEGKRNRRIAKKFKWNRFITGLTKVYDSMLKEV